MSLVNDALKKARMEAARGEVAKRGIPYPVLGRGQSPSTAKPVLIGIALVALALVGYLLYSAGQRSALDEARAGDEAAGPDGAPALVAERSEPADVLLELAPAEAEAPGTSTRPEEISSPPAGSPTRSRPEPAGNRPEPAAPPASKPARTETESTALPAEPEPAISQPSSRTEDPDAVAGGGEVPATPLPVSGATRTEATEAPDELANPSVAPAEQEYLRRAEVPGVGPVELGGIAWSGDRPFALLNGKVVRPGDSVSGLRVDQIQPNTVRLVGDAGTLVLKLK